MDVERGAASRHQQVAWLRVSVTLDPALTCWPAGRRLRDDGVAGVLADHARLGRAQPGAGQVELGLVDRQVDHRRDRRRRRRLRRRSAAARHRRPRRLCRARSAGCGPSCARPRRTAAGRPRCRPSASRCVGRAGRRSCVCVPPSDADERERGAADLGASPGGVRAIGVDQPVDEVGDVGRVRCRRRAAGSVRRARRGRAGRPPGWRRRADREADQRDRAFGPDQQAVDAEVAVRDPDVVAPP